MTSDVLHLRCGDDILSALAQAGLPGEFARWCDPLCEGPIRPWPDDGARREERSAWLARHGEDPAAVRESLEREDMTLASAARRAEVVLWFEADLFDQSILVYLLDRLAELAPDRTRLICIGEHPDIPQFVGLGQLRPHQLAALFPLRQPVTAEQFALASETWRAFQSDTPEALWAIAQRGTPALPFLAGAVMRWLAELPSVRNGLGMTEGFALSAFAAGVDSPFHAFPVVQRFESRPWQGDSMLYAQIRLLASGPAPLLRPLGKMPRPSDRGFEQTRFEVTEWGQAVLAGKEDWFRLSGVSRWHGNILLEGPRPAWRWDERREAPVRADLL